MRPTPGRRTKTGRKRIRILLGGIFVIALCGVIRHYWGASPAHADADRSEPTPATSLSDAPVEHVGPRIAQDRRPPSVAAARSADSQDRSETSIPAVVATVNTQRITREDLARDCLRHFGKEVLESMVNKRLIMLECQQQGITVTRSEVNAEIEGMAKRFKIPVDQWLKMLKQERNVSPEQYADDIIWPTIALRKLAGEQLRVSDEEVRTEYDTQYGEQIKARLIAVGDLQKAKELRARAAANPEQFRQPRQGVFGRLRQRERQGSDQPDPPARKLPGDRGRRVQHARRRDLAGDPRGRTVRDPQARRGDAARTTRRLKVPPRS